MKRGGMALILLAGAIVVIGGCSASRRPGQFTLQLKPVAPLSAKACVSQARRYGSGAGGGTVICRSGKGRSWYHAVLTNRGQGAYPACRAIALDTRGRTVFNGPLSFNFGGVPAGLFSPGHRSITFSWYLPEQTRGPVTRYTSACSPNPRPPM